uniref:Uncharacterized protein TCIL3000_11_11230 n=1 Tax=Trypanosoma congolense (strain IL3000) TaxID=1068625 RepID=G0V1W3_TRYCI|nr:unnamed protein product [Trypanosoma congolense IL3000]
MSYRVFGSPYALLFHQHVTYLRLKKLPFKVYCRTFSTTLFYAWLYRARNSFCTVSPSGASHLQLWQLVSAVEGDATHRREQSLPHLDSNIVGCSNVRIVVNKSTHPNIHLVNWVVVVYSSWWLAKTGAIYRWFEVDNVDTIDGYLRYFFFVPGVGVSRAIARPFKEAMQRITAITGVSKGTAPYMKEHFIRLCTALESHLCNQQKLEGSRATFLYLLGTPHPTLSDVALGSVFSANFLMDDPPASLIVQRYPHLIRYLEMVTGWKGGEYVGECGESTEPNGEVSVQHGTNSGIDGNNSAYMDTVPDSLADVLLLIEEVFPFMVSQCESFIEHMLGDGVRQLKRERLEGPWEGCSGYLLPQVTKIKSLMIIDDDVHTVFARAQDLEVALLAAREVVGDDVVNECDGHEEVAASVDLSSAPGTPGAVDESSKCERYVTESVVNTVSVSDAAPPSEGRSRTANAVSANDPVRCAEPSINKIIEELKEKNVLNSDTAQFHRVFTEATARSRAVLKRQSSSRGISLTNIDKCLDRLRVLLKKIHTPHYTLATVFHGRRMFIAVIPEHEAEAARKRGVSRGRLQTPPM